MNDLFGVQRDFTQRFVREKLGKELEELTDQEKLDFVKDYVLHLHQELSSILGNTSYKMHRNPMDQLIHPNIFEEIIDTVKFSMGLWCILGRDYDDFTQCFQDKSNVVSWRWKQDQDIDTLSSMEVAILDIDGVLAQYPGPMLEYFGSKCGRVFRSKGEAKRELGVIEYEKLKTDYRTSGFKSTLPLVDGAKEFLDFLSSKGYPIVLISSRPYERYLNILTDTLKWAKLWNIEFDALYFNRDKGLKVAQRFPKARIFVDDNAEFVGDIVSSCTDIEGNKMEVFLFDPSGTKTSPEGSARVVSFLEIMKILENTK